MIGYDSESRLTKALPRRSGYRQLVSTSADSVSDTDRSTDTEARFSKGPVLAGYRARCTDEHAEQRWALIDH
jgi:hypothetical protein